MCPERANLVWPVLLVLEFRLLSQGQCFLFDYQLKAVHRFRLLLSGMRCRFLGCGYVFKPGRADRIDPYCAGGVRILYAFPCAGCGIWEESSMQGQTQ